MKGLIITQQVCDSVLDWTHGMIYEIKRIFIPDADNLVITPHNKQVYAWTGFEGEYTIIKEIEVPDELVKEALAFVRMKNKFDGLKEKFEALLK
jgi:hypothetical protein